MCEVQRLFALPRYTLLTLALGTGIGQRGDQKWLARSTITILTQEDDTEEIRGRTAIPVITGQALRAVEVSKAVMRASLAELVKDVNDMLCDTDDRSGEASIDQVSVSVQITRNGQLQWIAGVGANVGSSMTVTVKVRP